MINAGGARGGQRESKGGRETERENIHGRVKYRGRHRHCRETDKQAIACENAAMGVVIVISTVQYCTCTSIVQLCTGTHNTATFGADDLPGGAMKEQGHMPYMPPKVRAWLSSPDRGLHGW